MRIYDLLSSVGHWAHYRLSLCASADPRPTRSDGIEDLLCVNHAHVRARLQPRHADRDYLFIYLFLWPWD